MIRSNGIILQFSSSLLVCFAAYNFQVKAQSFLAACLEAQGFDRIHRGRAIRWIQRRKNGNHSQQSDGHCRNLPAGQHAAEKRGHGGQGDQTAEAIRDDQADAAADGHDENRFEEKLAQDGTPRCTERHTHADFARALANADSITFITLSPPRKRVATPTAPMNTSMPTIIMRLACAFFTVSQMPAASSSRGSKWCRRPSVRRIWWTQSKCVSSDQGATSKRSTLCSTAGGLFGKSRRMALKGIKTFRVSKPS